MSVEENKPVEAEKKSELAKDLSSSLWEVTEEKDLQYNLSLADNLIAVAGFLFIGVKKVARKHKDIFGKRLISIFLESTGWSENEPLKVKLGSQLDQAYTLIGLQQRERPKITKALYDIVSLQTDNSKFSFLSELEDEDIDWLIPNMIQLGVIHQFQGAMDIGKSMITADITAKVSVGGHIFGHQVAKGKVLYISTEDSPTKVIKQRIKSMGGDLNNVAVLSSRDMLTFPSGIDQVNDFVLQHRPSLIVLDPILSMFEGDMNSETSARKVIVPLVQLADYYNVAIIYITHTGKAKKENANHNGLGSQGITAIARANFEIAVDDDTGERIISCIKNNNGSQKLSWSFEIVEHEGFVAPRVKHNGLTKVKAHELNKSEALVEEIKTEILDYLESEGEKEAKALRVYFSNIDTSNSMRTFENARASLVSSGKIEKYKKADNKYYYRIPASTTGEDVKM